MTVITRCPRCRGEALEIFKTHDYCSHCNYSSEFSDEAYQLAESLNPIIPEWAIAHMDLSDEDRAEILEINTGKYAPGYELIVDTKRRPVVLDVAKDIAKKNQARKRVGDDSKLRMAVSL